MSYRGFGSTALNVFRSLRITYSPAPLRVSTTPSAEYEKWESRISRSMVFVSIEAFFSECDMSGRS